MNLRFIFFFIPYIFVLNSIFINDTFSSGESIKQDSFIEQSSECITEEELNSLKLRIMQDQIRIASRNCKNLDQKLLSKLNKKYKKIFESNDLILEIFFQKFGGDNPNREMNNFITENSNTASLKIIYNKKDFCDNQKHIIEKLTETDISNISEFVNKNIKQKISNPKLCD